ncbi:2',5'-phosphodiesterase 12-like isoform X2 [Prorops nasuta]
MNEAVIRSENNSEDFTFSFRYVNPDLNVDKTFNLSRKNTETLDNFRQRITLKLTSVLDKKCKTKNKRFKNKEGVEKLEYKLNNDDVVLLKDGTKLDGNALCKNIFEDVTNLKLLIQGSEYYIKKNVPAINNIALPKTILADLPVYPSKLEAINVDKNKSIFSWYRKDLNHSSHWEKIAEGFFYTPNKSDIGYLLKINCLPKNDIDSGLEVEIESKSTVEAGPGICPFENRHIFTGEKLSGSSFRIVSYNILADTYTDSDFTRDVLFPYCPPYALEIDYRIKLVFKELTGFKADIICLQEVDEKIFNNDLVPVLSILNYDGVYNTKRNMREGLATFFDSNRFEKIASESTVICNNTNLEPFNKVWSNILNPKTKERFLGRNTIVQSTILRSKESPSQILVIGNTHLYFKPDADHIRLLQGFFTLMYIDDIAKKIKKQFADSNVSILLCGDFNSTPDCGIYQLMTENYVPETCKDWEHSEEKIENVSLFHDLQMDSACGKLPFTNYTPDFSGCLDYIFYQKDKLSVQQVVPTPSFEELTLHVGLPSVVFPSDHISLCVDLKWSS